MKIVYFMGKDEDVVNNVRNLKAYLNDCTEAGTSALGELDFSDDKKTSIIS